MKVAIIGTGISGLGAAYLLRPDHDIVVFEKHKRIGGHTRTIDISTPSGPMPVDTGFIVFNDWNYPNLQALFERLRVPYEKSNMSFGVSIKNGWLEYSSDGLFAQKVNAFRPAYLGMLADILKFNRRAPAFIGQNAEITLEECLDSLGMGQWFRQYYLLAMGAAIWSCPVETILKFPARTFLQFFKNHGLLNIRHRPQWYTVTGGAREYLDRISSGFKDKIRKDTGVQKVRISGGEIQVIDHAGHIENFNRVVFACHADEALKLIENPDPAIRQVLGAFRYQENRIIVHRDEDFMPKNKKCWASWVYLSETKADSRGCVSLTYWMNNLQNLNPLHPVFVTLNPGRRPSEETIYDEHVFTHPVFDLGAIRAQDKIGEIQGKNGFYFCGAYQCYGFHEDGLLSAVNVSKLMGSEIPWS